MEVKWHDRKFWFNRAFDSWVLPWTSTYLTPKQFYRIASFLCCRVRNFEGVSKKEKEQFFRLAKRLSSLHHG